VLCFARSAVASWDSRNSEIVYVNTTRYYGLHRIRILRPPEDLRCPHIFPTREIHEARPSFKPESCTMSCSLFPLMQQHRAQLKLSNTDAEPGSLGRIRCCTAPASVRPSGRQAWSSQWCAVIQQQRGPWRTFYRQASGGPPGAPTTSSVQAIAVTSTAEPT